MIKPCAREQEETGELQLFVTLGLRFFHGGALEKQDQGTLDLKGQYFTALPPLVSEFGLTQEGCNLEKCVSAQ